MGASIYATIKQHIYFKEMYSLFNYYPIHVLKYFIDCMNRDKFKIYPDESNVFIV